ncbi:hypothetical protein C8Q76DRAFT_693729 [Earliella scabrosa]|nr:hypothetical protein C8Q76DRAFT_693729 [Earliella scabrosa]
MTQGAPPIPTSPRQTARPAHVRRDVVHINNASEPVKVDREAPPAALALPDLSRLSLADPTVARPGRLVPERDTSGAPPPGSVVHITVHAHAQGAPVTVNIMPREPGADRDPGPVDTGVPIGREYRRIRVPRGVAPPASPARVRVGGTPAAPPAVPPPGPPSPRATHRAPPVPRSPLLHGVQVLPSPRLESVPNTTPAVSAFGSPPGSPAGSPPASPAVAAATLAGEEGHEYVAPPNPAHTGKWYVVTTGRCVGIWPDWLDMAGYVIGVPGNQHKSFATRAEAEAHYFTTKEAGNVWIVAP